MLTGQGLTFSPRYEEVLPEKLVSPVYWAEMACPPTESADVENCAELLERLPKPMRVGPSKKATPPVAVLPEPGWTVAGKGVDWPTRIGVGLEAMVGGAEGRSRF